LAGIKGGGGNWSYVRNQKKNLVSGGKKKTRRSKHKGSKLTYRSEIQKKKDPENLRETTGTAGSGRREKGRPKRCLKFVPDLSETDGTTLEEGGGYR